MLPPSSLRLKPSRLSKLLPLRTTYTYVSLTHKNSSSRFVDSLGTSQLVEMSLVGYIIYYILYILLHIVMYPTKGILM